MVYLRWWIDNLDDNTPMKMVSKAAEKVLKLPTGMHYRNRLLWVRSLRAWPVSELPKILNERHRVKVVRNPSEEDSGNKFEGEAYWRGGNQTLANQLSLASDRVNWFRQNWKWKTKSSWRAEEGSHEKHPPPSSPDDEEEALSCSSRLNWLTRVCDQYFTKYRSQCIPTHNRWSQLILRSK